MKRTSLVAALTVVLVGFSTVVASTATAAACTVSKSRSDTWTKVSARDNCANVQARIDKYIEGSGLRSTLGFQGPTLSVAVDNHGVWSGAYYRTKGSSGTWSSWIKV